MTRLEDPSHIEQVVGRRRHPSIHYGRADLAEDRFYILHSGDCRDRLNDLRLCPFSIALDRGIRRWARLSGEPVELELSGGWLVPVRTVDLPPYPGAETQGGAR